MDNNQNGQNQQVQPTQASLNLQSTGYNPNLQNTQNTGYNPNLQPQQNTGYNPNLQPQPNTGYNPNLQTQPNTGYNPNLQSQQNTGYNPNLQTQPNTGYNPNLQTQPNQQQYNQQQVNQPQYNQNPQYAQNPQYYQQAPPPQKKGNGCLKGCLITLLIFIIIVALLVVSVIVLLKKSKDPMEVDYSKKDVASFYEKTGMEEFDDRPSIEDILTGKFTASGELPLDDTITSEEVTAIFQSSSSKNDVIQKVSVQFGEDGQIELGGIIGDKIEDIYDTSPELKQFKGVIDQLIDSPVYFLGNVEYDEADGFSVDVDKVKVGFVSIPETIVAQYSGVFEEVLNKTLNSIEGLSIESFEITEDGLDFVGTVPEAIEAKIKN